jgi:hypothetical protein
MSACLLQHGFDPLLAVTSRSPRVLSGTIPLLFDRKLPEQVARAKACYRHLVKVGLENGWPPYRLGVDFMDLIACPADSASAQVQRQLKKALDENNVIASGRYEHAKPEDHAARIDLEKLITLPADYSAERAHNSQQEEQAEEQAEA